MTIEQIKDEVSRMPDEQQDDLFAHLLLLRHKRNPDIGRELSEAIDDRDPAHWVPLDRLREHWKD